MPSLLLFEDAIDKAVGLTFTLHVWRLGATHHTVTLNVYDLSRLVDYQIFQYAGSTFENLLYAMAINYLRPLRGVYVSQSKTFLDGIIVVTLDGHPTLKLQDFIDIVRGILGKQTRAK